MKTNTDENDVPDESEITSALKTIVAAVNNNDNTSETEQPKDEASAAGTPTQLTNGSEESTATVSS